MKYDVYIGEDKVNELSSYFMDEDDIQYFKFTINSGTDSSFMLPLAGYYGCSDVSTNRHYDLVIDWGDGNQQYVSGDGYTESNQTVKDADGNYIKELLRAPTYVSHTYENADTNYQITITPKDFQEESWLKCFGFTEGAFYCNSAENKAKMISLDSPFNLNMFGKKNGNNLSEHGMFYFMFCDCPNLTMGPDFNLPQNMKYVGGNFASGMFSNCDSITMNEIFQLPPELTYCSSSFCSSMFINCSNLELNDVFQLPQNMTTFVGFCQYMFHGCSSIKKGVKRFFGNVMYPIYDNYDSTSVWSFVNTFYGCSGIDEYLSPTEIPQLTVLPAQTINCFKNASAKSRKYVPVNYGGVGTEMVDKFKFTINSGSDSAFILPMSSQFGSGTAWSLDIDWGDGTSETSTGTSSTANGSGVTHTYSEANKDYQITLFGPTGYLKQFGFFNKTTGCNANTNKAKMKSLDSAFTTKMFAETIDSTTNNLFSNLFWNCVNLIMGDKFNFPQDIQAIGTNFAASMFKGCTNLTMGSAFNLPQQLTTVGNSFCNTTFTNCTMLTMNDVFNLPPHLTTVDGRFCPWVFMGCTNLTMNDVCQLPQNLTSVGIYFLYQGFYGCTSITTGIHKFFGNIQLSADQLNQSNNFVQCFANCSSVSEEISDKLIPQLLIIPTNDKNCFAGINENLLINCPTNWK